MTRNGIAKMNIFFDEWNYKSNGETPAITVCIFHAPSCIASCLKTLLSLATATPYPALICGSFQLAPFWSFQCAKHCSCVAWDYRSLPLRDVLQQAVIGLRCSSYNVQLLIPHNATCVLMLCPLFHSLAIPEPLYKLYSPAVTLWWDDRNWKSGASHDYSRKRGIDCA